MTSINDRNNIQVINLIVVRVHELYDDVAFFLIIQDGCVYLRIYALIMSASCSLPLLTNRRCKLSVVLMPIKM
uniref:Uncharacterized protein n=1 Tax=Anguilla anguilla TaxID=7936 RepID=A0A0E9T1I5_ANGAN